MMKKNENDYDWDEVLSAASRLQGQIREAVLVGGTASALFAEHRTSYDADHVLPHLREHFDQILTDLESVAGWQTARVKRPVLILGSLDGVETGIRQLIREKPLETTEIYAKGQKIRVPTEEEVLRIKGALVLKRNATRDYLDFAALSQHLGQEKTVNALRRFDDFYPQKNGASPLQQVYIQLANPKPFDLEDVNLSTYKNLNSHWQNWENVKEQCQNTASVIINSFPSLQKERSEELQREQSFLIESAPDQEYSKALKEYVQAKALQVERIEEKLTQVVTQQQMALKRKGTERPGAVTSLWKGTQWKKEQKQLQNRLQVLQRRLSWVKKIRHDMGGKRLEEMALKKLRKKEPELTSRRDAFVKAQTEQMVTQHMAARKQQQEKARSQSLGRTRTMDE